MYAIIQHDGRQYQVEEGQEVAIDYRDATTGDEVKFDRILAFSNGTDYKLGSPLLANASVMAEVVGVTMGPKLVVQKFRRRKNSRRRTGHRQLYTKIRINKIAI